MGGLDTGSDRHGERVEGGEGGQGRKVRHRSDRWWTGGGAGGRDCQVSIGIYMRFGRVKIGGFRIAQRVRCREENKLA